MTELTSKQKVLAVWPDAHIADSYGVTVAVANGCIIGNSGMTGDGSEETAWDDAASKLPVPQESEGVASEVQRYEPFSSGTVPEGWPDEYVDSDDYDDLLEKYEQLAAHPSLVETAPDAFLVQAQRDALFEVVYAIANANWREWKDGMNTPEEFVTWARSLSARAVKDCQPQTQQ